MRPLAPPPPVSRPLSSASLSLRVSQVRKPVNVRRSSLLVASTISSSRPSFYLILLEDSSIFQQSFLRSSFTIFLLSSFVLAGGPAISSASVVFPCYWPQQSHLRLSFILTINLNNLLCICRLSLLLTSTISSASVVCLGY